MKNSKVLKGFLATIMALIISMTMFTDAVYSASKWTKVTLIRHACGGIDGYSYTNSKEALMASIAAGDNAIKMDFRYTKDGTLICAHNWGDVGLKSAPTYKKFKKLKIKGQYTTMTAKTALKLMVKSNAFLIIDTKEKDVIKVYTELNNILMSIKGGSKYRKMLVPQIYSKEEYAQLRKIYKYKNWIFTLYKLNLQKNSEFKDIATFCKKKKIATVTVPKKRLQPSVYRTLQNAEFHLLPIPLTMKKK